MAAQFTFAGGGVVPIAGLARVVYANPTMFGPAVSPANNGSLAFWYTNGSVITLSSATDVGDALATLGAIQHVIQLSQFPSTIA